MSDSTLPAGPAAPTSGAIGALRPLALDAVQLDPSGLLGGWQERNAAATLPHCVENLESAGNLDNVRRLLGDSTEKFQGMWFADSDIYKTLEAAAWELGRRPGSSGPAQFLSSATSLLAKAQDADGYLNSYFQGDHRDEQWQTLMWSHELYCAGHLIQAAVAAQRAGVGEQLLPVARRLADLLVSRFGVDGIEAVDGHPEIETALVELYRVTGHRPYLDLAARFVDLRGQGLLGEDAKFGRQYYQDHLPVRDAPEVTGHVVRQLYLLAGVVDVAVETGDSALLDAAARLWESAFETKTYLTGTQGSRHRDEAFGDPYELPPDRAYAESCAAIASFQWNWRMLLATGGHRYADELERALYNGIAGSTALDGRHFFYSNPLQLRTGHDGSNEDAPSSRLSWYSCSCCPPNLARLMASLQSYVATSSDSGLQLHLYASGRVSTGFGVVDVETDYPWDGRVTLAVRPSSADTWTLALRIPSWCASFHVEVDGNPVYASAEEGYLRLTRRWESEARVVLTLEMPARLVSAHPRVDAVRGCLALLRGPLVYCLEGADVPPDVLLEDLFLDATAPVEVLRAAAGAGIDPGIGAGGDAGVGIDAGIEAGGDAGAGGHTGAGIEAGAGIPVTLRTTGLLRAPGSGSLYASAPVGAGDSRPVTLTAVPYFLWANRAAGPMRIWIPAL